MRSSRSEYREREMVQELEPLSTLLRGVMEQENSTCDQGVTGEVDENF